MACVAIRQPVAAKGSIRRASVEESWKRMPALSSSSKLRGGAAQAAVQAFRAFFEWLTGRGLRHVHGGRALAPHLLMKGADGGSLPRERRARCLLQQVRVMVNEATDRDTCISGLFHAPIMPGRRASGMASAHHHVDGARLTVGN